MVQPTAQAKRLAALTLLLAAAAVGGCGGGSDNAKQGATFNRAPTTPASSGNPDLGVDVRLASCTDWARGDVAAREGTIREIRTFAEGPVGNGGGHGAVLTPERAYKVLDGWCTRSYAGNFKLYKLYTRSAAFTPQS
jgi:hypothetical protein